MDSNKNYLKREEIEGHERELKKACTTMLSKGGVPLYEDTDKRENKLKHSEDAIRYTELNRIIDKALGYSDSMIKPEDIKRVYGHRKLLEEVKEKYDPNNCNMYVRSMCFGGDGTTYESGWFNDKWENTIEALEVVEGLLYDHSEMLAKS